MIAAILNYTSTILPKKLQTALRWRLFVWFPDYPGRGVYVSVGGARWKVYPKTNYTELFLYLKRKFPEPSSIEALASKCRGKKTLFFDIGANCGTYSVMIAKASATGSKVLAFEPNPVMQDRLKENLRLNDLEKSVSVEKVALSNKKGTATLKLADNLGEATISAEASGISVPTDTLASFLEDEESYEIFLLKIDVEGHEVEVLEPYFDTVPQDRWPTIILIETEHASAWRSDLLGRLAKSGYAAIFEGEGNTLLEWER